MLRFAAAVALSLSVFACAAESTAEDSASSEVFTGRDTTPAPSEDVAAPPAGQGRVGGHNQIVVGTPGDAIISHIPWFGNALHNVQCIVAGSFTATDGTELPVSFGDTEYSFKPARASLDALRLGTLRQLTGTLFLGNLEDGGRPVAQVRFDVSHVIHQHVLDDNARVGDLSYFLASAGGATYAFHELTKGPSFDDVLRVDVTDGPASWSGQRVTFRGVADDKVSRLSVSRPLEASGPGGRNVTVGSARPLSCLLGPDFSDPC